MPDLSVGAVGRVIGSNKLTFEEMSTVLSTIEPCLNSRPIWPMSDDPGDLCALTPEAPFDRCFASHRSSSEFDGLQSS